MSVLTIISGLSRFEYTVYFTIIFNKLHSVGFYAFFYIFFIRVQALIKCYLLFTVHIVFCPLLQAVDMFHSHMHSMVEFAMALMAKLELINTHSFNSFKLRIGQNTHQQTNKQI